MIIRSAKLSDSKKIAFMHKASIKLLCKKHYNSHEIANWIQVISPAIYKSAIQEKIIIVAEEGAEILGLGILDIENQEISAVYIHPKTTGTGIGKKLLAELEQISAKNGLNHLTLCSTTNASGFYKKCGYAGSKIDFHKLPNGIKLKCIRMHKTLKSNP